MAVTMQQVAQKAGVSVSTVSRVLNLEQDRPVNQITRHKVLEAVRELGYAPNQVARCLAKGIAPIAEQQRRMLGCIYTTGAAPQDDPFFWGITQGIQMQAADLGYNVGYFCNLHNMSNSEIEAMLSSINTDGWIILGRFLEQTLKLIQNNNKNLVYAGMNSVDFKIPEVVCDSFRAVTTGIDHLVALGHTRIGYIGPDGRYNGQKAINEHRCDAYLSALAQNDIQYNPQWIGLTDFSNFSTEHGFEVAKRLLNRNSGITAVFCACDELAIGTINAARKMGISVPKQLAVMGLEDIDLAAYVDPPLTTIHIPKIDIGRWAVNLMEQMLRGGMTAPVKIDIPFELIVRSSCGKYA